MKKWLYWGSLFAILLVLVGWRFKVQKDANSPTGPKPGGGGKTTAVAVTKAGPRVILQTVQSVGNLESPIKVEISPKVSGRIDYLEAREGDIVTPGQLLLKVNPSDLEGAVVQQQASVAEAKSRLAQAELTAGATDVGIASQMRQQGSALASAKADYEQVQRNFDAQVAAAEAQVAAALEAVKSARSAVAKEQATLQNVQSHCDRIRGLYAKGFTAAQDLDDARTAVEVQKRSVEVAESQVSSAQSQVQVQQQNLSIVKRKGQSDIAASLARLDQAKAGAEVASANRSQSPAYRQNIEALKSQLAAAIAQQRQAESRLQDTVVSSTITGTVTARKADPGGLATPGQPVLEVQFLDWLYATTAVPIDAGPQIHAGQTAQISIDALPGTVLQGSIANINPAADPSSRQFGIKVKLDNRKHLLRPGMYARVSIITGRVSAAVSVPREAINRSKQDGSPTVTVISKDNVAEVRPVVLGPSDDSSTQILSGVRAGEQVVILTFTDLHKGQKVTLDLKSSKDEAGKGEKPHG